VVPAVGIPDFAVACCKHPAARSADGDCRYCKICEAMFRLTATRRLPKVDLSFVCSKTSGIAPALARATCRRTTRAQSTSGSSNEESSSKSRRGNRRRRLLLNGNANDSIPSYKDFLHRWTVVTLYRNFLTAIRSLPNSQEDLKVDLRLQVKRDFQAHKRETDAFNTQRALAEGRRRYQELLCMVPKDHSATTSSSSSPSVTDDAWLNIVDPEDTRGRVGTGWPWEEK
jgi:Complex 1 protein (LYR family)